MRVVWLLLIFCVSYSQQISQNAPPTAKYHKAEKMAMFKTFKDMNELTDAYNRADYVMVLIKGIDLYKDMDFDSPMVVSVFLTSSRYVLVGIHSIYVTIFPSKAKHVPQLGYSTPSVMKSVVTRDTSYLESTTELSYLDQNSTYNLADDESVKAVIDAVSQYEEPIMNTLSQFLF